VIKALILDYGGVLSYPQPAQAVDAMVAASGCPREAFVEAYWRHREALDRGLDPGEYWRTVLGEAGGRPQDAGRLLELDLASWLHLRPEMWDLAATFRRRGATAILSNNWPVFMTRLRAVRPLADWFDTVVASYEVGMVKPSPEIFHLCLERLGQPADAALFVDDNRDNVEAARAVGMQGLWFRGQDDLAPLQDMLKFVERVD
jgi:putative hydrolase of the HAD superfamily